MSESQQVTLWVARDSDRQMHLFTSEPKWEPQRQGVSYWTGSHFTFAPFSDALYPEVGPGEKRRAVLTLEDK